MRGCDSPTKRPMDSRRGGNQANFLTTSGTSLTRAVRYKTVRKSGTVLKSGEQFGMTADYPFISSISGKSGF